ncbi:hypothetical protein NLX83_32085 [Allokutzneria sp. A3M-2-11 16]|uniref:hypothetical protein n=1 Tax=Allokutzneria sp. A3M-2-11 16 TaxID=2962043 RepID=UPI0020B8B2EF|nr:hypothetical protein [Allokutzneria sp. A3M-2-11 16]MCP3803918.1 hypothetical protein [Allokutzneria sp. A3M-2-11 16]
MGDLEEWLSKPDPRLSTVRDTALAVVAVCELLIITWPTTPRALSWLTSQSAVWWGAVGTWVGACATTAAVVAALWIAGRDARVREAERADRDKAQARLLVVVMANRGQFVTVRVENHSAAPLFDVTLTHVEPALGWRFGPSTVQRPSQDILKAGEHFQRNIELLGGNGEPQRVPDLGYSFTFEFVDSAGLRWSRRDDAEPQRVLAATTG